MRTTAFAELFLDDMAIVKPTMRSEMNHEDCTMNIATIVLLHDERYFHITGKRDSSGFILRVFDGSLGVFAENGIQLFGAEKCIPVGSIGHLN